MQYQLPIHVSDVTSYMRCKRKWWWGSHLGANLESNIPRSYFTYGRVVHYALDQFYAHQRHPVDAMYEWAEAEVRVLAQRLGVLPGELAAEYEQLFGDCAKVLQHYLMWREATLADAEIDEWVAHEQEFSVPLRPQLGSRASGALRYEGRFDGVVRLRGDPRPWVWEVKTARTIKKGQLEYLTHDLQATMYVYACREMYGDCGGVYYTFLRKKPPADPRVLKSGALSEDVRQDTSPWWYEHKLREMAAEQWHTQAETREAWALDALCDTSVALQSDFLVKLEQNMTPFFRRVRITRAPAQINSALALMRQVGLDTRRATHSLGESDVTPHQRASVVFPAEPSWLECREHGCSFYIPCLLQLKGQDWHQYLRGNFSERRGWDPELEREEDA